MGREKAPCGKRFDCGSIKGFDATMYMGKNRGLL